MVTFAKELKMLFYGFFGIIFIGDALKWTTLTGPQEGQDCQDQSWQYCVYFFWKVNSMEWLEIPDWNSGPDEVSIWTGDAGHQFCHWWWFSCICTSQILVTSAIAPLHQNFSPILSSYQQRTSAPSHPSLSVYFQKAKLNDLSPGQSTILHIQWCLTCPRSSPIRFSQG